MDFCNRLKTIVASCYTNFYNIKFHCSVLSDGCLLLFNMKISFLFANYLAVTAIIVANTSVGNQLAIPFLQVLTGTHLSSLQCFQNSLVRILKIN